MDDHLIAGVHITQRVKHAAAVQAVLTQYGCNIKTRLGLHETGPDACSPNGVLILELVGDSARCEALLAELAAIEGVAVQSMRFGH